MNQGQGFKVGSDWRLSCTSTKARTQSLRSHCLAAWPKSHVKHQTSMGKFTIITMTCCHLRPSKPKSLQLQPGSRAVLTTKSQLTRAEFGKTISWKTCLASQISISPSKSNSSSMVLTSIIHKINLKTQAKIWTGNPVSTPGGLRDSSRLRISTSTWHRAQRTSATDNQSQWTTSTSR